MFSKDPFGYAARNSSEDRSGEYECANELAVSRYIFDRDTQSYRPQGVKTQKFIRGPIPLEWVAAANALPGKAGAVGVALWFLVGVRGDETIKLTRQIERIAGCGRKAIYTALTNLEHAGLVAIVHRSVGERATVRVCKQPKGWNRAPAQ